MSYKIIYNLNHKIGNFTKEEVLKEVEKDPMHAGATDSFIFVSILNSEGGTSSAAVISVDGKTNGPLPNTELFKVWSMIAHNLSEMNIPEWQKEIALNAFNKVKEKLTK